jgi:hypothetical protein
MEKTDDLVKVRVDLAGDSWHGQSAEHLWAEPVPQGLRLRNTPFYAYELSAGDVVQADDDEDGDRVLRRIIERGGHSTYRLSLSDGLTDESGDFRRCWRPLEQLGVSYEGADKRYLAVDVPPEVDVHAAYELFELGEAAGVWDFEEGHCGHPVGGPDDT